MQFAVPGLLTRHASLGIRAVTFDIYPHPERDPGCLLRGHELLRQFGGTHAHALVMFDREGCGRDDLARGELEQRVLVHLRQSGWDDRAAAIVLDPELEIWVWTDSPQVEIVLGWAGRQPSLRSWMQDSGFTTRTSGKPNRPKEALLRALRQARKPRSSSLYLELAENVSLENCVHPAFGRFREILQGWFPSATPVPV